MMFSGDYNLMSGINEEENMTFVANSTSEESSTNNIFDKLYNEHKVKEKKRKE